MILIKINNLIKITEDNIFVQAKNYGVEGIIDNWLTKLFSPSVTNNFDDLISSVDSAANLFKIESIATKDNEEILNRAIHKCRADDGKCIINIFYNAINQVISLILDKYVDILFQLNVQNLESVSSFQELAKLDLSNYNKIGVFDKAIYDIYDNYINSINQKNFNKFFFKMRGSVIDTTFIKEKINFLDNYVVTAINNKTGKRMSITQK